jgi:hypothetical protein
VPDVLDKRILETDDMLGEDSETDRVTEDAAKGFIDTLLRNRGFIFISRCIFAVFWAWGDVTFCRTGFFGDFL